MMRVTSRGRSRTVGRVTAAFVCALIASVGAQSTPGPPPDVVRVPAGLNRGGSSFYDGFGKTDPGWVFLNFSRLDHLTSVKDNNGENSPAFTEPRIDAFSSLMHIVYITPLHMPAGGAFALEALLPVVGFDTAFNPAGPVLRDHGWRIGDLTFGVDYQSPPIPFDGSKVISWRAGLDFVAPVGGFDSRVELNQGSGFWSFTPYLAATLLPVPAWEVTTRVTYDYNFSTTRGANPPATSGFTFHDGQAGQALVTNFASSYALFGRLRPGINGYWLQQITDDRTNGVAVPFSRVKELYLGPGLSWQIDRKHVLNLNVYIPVRVKNTPAGPQFNVQTIIQF